MKTIEQILADNVRRFRKAKNLTQSQLAEKADLSLDMVQKVEGQRSWPGKSTVRKLSTALKVDEFSLFQIETILQTNTQKLMANTISALQDEVDELKGQMEKLSAGLMPEWIKAGLELDYIGQLSGLYAGTQNPKYLKQLQAIAVESGDKVAIQALQAFGVRPTVKSK